MFCEHTNFPDGKKTPNFSMHFSWHFPTILEFPNLFRFPGCPQKVVTLDTAWKCENMAEIASDRATGQSKCALGVQWQDRSIKCLSPSFSWTRTVERIVIKLPIATSFIILIIIITVIIVVIIFQLRLLNMSTDSKQKSVHTPKISSISPWIFCAIFKFGPKFEQTFGGHSTSVAICHYVAWTDNTTISTKAVIFFYFLSSEAANATSQIV